MVKHIVWDWNGTLLDDFEITAQYGVDYFAKAGLSGVSFDDVRQHHTRPFANYIKALLGRDPTDTELADFHSGFGKVYEPAMYDLPLAADALDALEVISGAGNSQSILSMAPHQELVSLVRHNGIYERFTRVDGAQDQKKHFKIDALQTHCDALGVEPANVCLIGDSIDDFDAANGLGAFSVLVSTGMYAHERLAATGAPVATNLVGAVAEALK
ncbi:Phosphoglycolate phosphatase [Pseudovibrio axinellae]|uniref:phosphoglycolate phosphatase n=1 Tax=Pseudovibrio axinellae TaxID=989403 RepID=A0A161XI07_9HYPH|nr:HAD hydrolase-like protein [Pseudovibrio axinellae]KZL21573.1 Phosphoglycolate phosphatase [Pseudovibrio axinellae]SER10084.1 haloacid dehalogenase superfamily, subfamily IA, variant 1 with third motif having Dx(3-4)D or Dx(3-4)E [Pseudovibrio axinellae]